VAHLRVCGGTPNWSISNGRLDARSPRVRRHRSTEPMPDPIDSSISACAEAPGAPRPRAGHKALDLRVCGGTTTAPARRATCSARSPRVRRHHPPSREGCAEERSISACAEAPAVTLRLGSQDELDLRVCGGTLSSGGISPVSWARSPRVRRHPRRSFRKRRRRCSISACAEAPLRKWPTGAWERLDLRVCGGTQSDATDRRHTSARSPRVRRHLLRLHDYAGSDSSISACAEAPRIGPCQWRSARLDLRVCGGT